MIDPHTSQPAQPEEVRKDDTFYDSRVVDAETLFAGEQEVLIRNGDDLYRLRRTRQGKLILNK